MNGFRLKKLLIHLLLFTFCFFLCAALFFITSYKTRYGSSISFEETADFEERFSKSLERVAAYVQYRHRGFTPRAELSTLLGRPLSGNTYSILNEDSEQSSFEFYNRKLNSSETSFLYYVLNSSTGEELYSPLLDDLYQKDGSFESRGQFMSSLMESGAPYFVLNTSDCLYSTNLGTHGYINSNTLDWIIECVTGTPSDATLSPESDQEEASGFSSESSVPNIYSNADISQLTSENPAAKAGGDIYIIYATSLLNFAETNDDFTPLYRQFLNLRQEYLRSKSLLPFLVLFFLAVLCAALYLCGHRRQPVRGENHSVSILLSGFDKIYTEFFLLFYAGAAALLGSVSSYFVYGFLPYQFAGTSAYLDEIYYLLLFLLLYLLTAPCFFSLVRRIKTRTLLPNFFLYRAVRKIRHWIRRFFQNRNITYQAGAGLIIFLGVSIISGILCLMGDFGFLAAALLYVISFFLAALMLLRSSADLNIVITETEQIQQGDFDHKIPDNLRSPSMRKLGGYINNISDGFSSAVEEQLKSERLKTELITNVSHDIKTPLTSIINYVDLLKKIDLQNETANGYLEILENKSWRLKTLIEDLVEASKASSGAISLHLVRLNFPDLVRQSCGEFEDKFQERHLDVVLDLPEYPVYILADGRSTFRIVENVLSNVYKYAMEGTRVYVDSIETDSSITISIKNISATQLNIDSDELMARFVRGDLSRNTEGSGLGLSIAQSLAKLQNAKFEIVLDGDLFKALITFEKLEPTEVAL